MTESRHPSSVLRPPSPLSPARLDELLTRIAAVSVAVLGDFFLDKYLVTDPALCERSIETGLEARQVVEIRCSPGAAGTVTNNLAALGIAEIAAIGLIGTDGEGFDLKQGLETTGVNTESLFETARFTPTYLKTMVREAGAERELERLDTKNRVPTAAEDESRIIDRLYQLFGADSSVSGYDALVILDQIDARNHGVVTDRVREVVAEIAASRPDVYFFADSRSHIGDFTGVITKPNAYEALRALGQGDSGQITLDAAAKAGMELRERNGRAVFLTVGELGILVCEPGGCTHAPALPADCPIDIVGAGDSATAGIVTALCAGSTPVEAAALGNLCAAVTIRKLGTTGTASADEIRAAFGVRSDRRV